MPFVALELAEERSGFLNYFSPTSAAAFSGIEDGLLSNFFNVWRNNSVFKVE